VWVFHGHQATLHTTFVDVCMHVHVSCQPASHQVLMRPAGSVLGPNQTGETAQSWLSPPCTPHLPEASRPPSLFSRYLGEPWTAEHTRQIWKWPVCLLKSMSLQIPWPGPELESPRLQPQTCLPGCLPLQCFLHLQQQWWCWGLL